MNDISKLILKKKVGDTPVVAKMIGETPGYTDKLLKRTGSKKHLTAVLALAKVIAAREALIQEINTLNQ